MTTRLCDFTNLPLPLHSYTHAFDIHIDNGVYGVVLRRNAMIVYEPIVFRSSNKFEIRLAIREANEILSAIQRLRRKPDAQ